MRLIIGMPGDITVKDAELVIEAARKQLGDDVTVFIVSGTTGMVVLPDPPANE